MSIETYRVLLVEDQDGVAKIVGAALRESGTYHFQVERVSRLSDALTFLQKGGVDAVVLDLGLPDSTGYSTFLKVRENVAGAAILVLTALGDDSVGNLAVEAGAQDFLIKGQMDVSALPRNIYFAIQRKRREKPR